MKTRNNAWLVDAISGQLQRHLNNSSPWTLKGRLVNRRKKCSHSSYQNMFCWASALVLLAETSNARCVSSANERRASVVQSEEKVNQISEKGLSVTRIRRRRIANSSSVMKEKERAMRPKCHESIYPIVPKNSCKVSECSRGRIIIE